MTAVRSERVELPALTGLRGIAAWLVVLYHVRLTAGSQLPDEVIGFLGKGYLVVDLFFMLSGFVLWLNYSDKLRASGFSAVPGFMVRRLARIWPLHLFILALAAAFALLLELSERPNPTAYPWHELPLHLLLVQNWGFTETLSWNVPAWSISCEFAAYLLFPLLAIRVDWRKLPSPLLCLLILLLAVGLQAIMSLAGANTLGDQIARLGVLRAVVEFTIGTLVCALWNRWREAARPVGAVSLSCAVAASLLLFSGLIGEILAVPLIFAALLLAVALGRSSLAKLLCWRPVHYLGEISYSTYLAHFLLFVLFKLLFVSDAARVPLTSLGLFLMLTFVVSAALYHFVERPAQRGANRLYDNVRRARLERRRFRPVG